VEAYIAANNLIIGH